MSESLLSKFSSKKIEWRKLATEFQKFPTKEPHMPMSGDLLVKYSTGGVTCILFLTGKAIPETNAAHSVQIFADTEAELWKKAVKLVEKYRLLALSVKPEKTKKTRK